jgi:NAD(P)H dehydrogenase (quinone)
MTAKLLVTGASGHLGRLVVGHLLDTLKISPDRIAATSRTPQSLSDFAARGVDVCAADFDQPETLPAAFAGTDRLLLISTVSADRTPQHRAAIDAAVKAGVKHVIYTSVPNPVDPTLAIVRDHAATEQALADSDLPGWTVLRNNWYFENLDWTIPDLLKSGQWVTANGDGRMAYIGRDDLALAAATVLANGGDGKTIYTLGGAKAYTTAELADLIGRTFGKTIDVVSVPAEEIEKGMIAHGVPEYLAKVTASSQVLNARGGLADVTGDFRKITGREPKSLEDWLQENKARFTA